MDQASRIVIVTGAGGGVGETVVRRWLATGVRVLAVGGSPESLAKFSPSDRLATFVADLTTEEGAGAMVARCREVFGVPDTLIHLVGGFAMSPIDGPDSPDVWRKMMRSHADAPFYCYRAIVPSLRERGGGWIVGIGARAAVIPPAKTAAYAAAKAAMIALTQSMAAELRDANIHVNVILASTLDTPANRQAMGEEAAKKWVRPDDIADATLYLCSDAARAVHGATLEVYGQA